MKTITSIHFAVILISFPGNFVSHGFDVEEIQPDVEGGFLMLLNKVESIVCPILKPDHDHVYFDENDTKYLKKSFEIPEIKKMTFDVYYDRANSLQCVNVFILKSMSYHIQSTMPSENMSFDSVKDKLKLFERYFARMLSLLYIGRIKVPKWMAVMYLKLLAAVEQFDGERFFEVNDYLQKMSLFENAVDFYCRCQRNKYIPRRTDGESERFFYARWNVFGLMEQLYGSPRIMGDAYRYERMFTADNISLNFLLDDYEVIFRGKTCTDSDWTVTRERCIDHGYKIRRLRNRWLEKPSEIALFHFMFQRVVYTQVLLFVVFHLKSFAISWAPGCSCKCIGFTTKREQNIMAHWKSLIEPLKKAMLLVYAEDNLFDSILDLVENELPWSNDARTVELNVRLVLQFCLKELNIPNKKSVYDATIHVKKDDIDFNQVSENVNEFDNYVGAIGNLLTPVDHSLFFIKFLWKDILLSNNFSLFPRIKTYTTSIRF